MNPFDFVTDICSGKQNIMSEMTEEEVAKDYNQFLVNKALSYFYDTVLFANEMNIRTLDNNMHFAYLLNSIPKKKRFAKWEKRENTENIQLIQKHYGYSYNKAKEVLSLFSEQQLKLIANQYDEGGVNGK